jgi:hypothetical protein
MSVEIAIYFSIETGYWFLIFNTFLFTNLPSFFQFLYNIKRKVIQIINTNDLIVAASGK